jgi:hypothetical protein
LPAATTTRTQTGTPEICSHNFLPLTAGCIFILIFETTMTLFAGILNLSPDKKIPEPLRNGIKKNICRNPETGSFNLFENEEFFLVKWDSGAFGEKAWQEFDGGKGVIALAGDPLLTQAGSRLPRDQQLNALRKICEHETFSVLNDTRGSFSLVYYNSASKTLNLVIDHVGIRQLCVYTYGHLILFSTTLRVFEDTAEIPIKVSNIGILEKATFRFSLANRSVYENILWLREAEIFSVKNSAIKRHHYYDWPSNLEFSGTKEDAAHVLMSTFEDAIRLRLSPQETHVYAYLSGGMDSRAIVSAIIKQQRRVEALNFSQPCSQELAYAKMFSEQTSEKCHIHCFPWKGAYPNFSLIALEEIKKFTEPKVERPSFIWSGDGGSVVLGYVFMDQKLLDLCQSEGIESGTRYYNARNNMSFPFGILNQQTTQSLRDLVFNNVMTEINRYECEDKGRQIYLLILLHHQRCHLFKHFESIDLHGLEFLTPFYDGTLLKILAKVPCEWGILHRLYSAWFDLLPSFARTTPWQVYPGHVPCPVPSPENLSYQWDKKKRDSFGKRLAAGHSIFKSTYGNHLPRDLFSAPKIRLAAILHSLGLKNYDYIDECLKGCLGYYQKQHK